MPPPQYPLPSHFGERALTAQYIVALYELATRDTKRVQSGVGGVGSCPKPPGHLEADMVADCQAIANSLSHAARNQYKVGWEAEKYAKDAPKVSKYNARREEKLLHRYPPLTSVAEVLHADGHLKLVEGPAVFTDAHDNVLAYALPNIIPPRRQESILQIMRHLEDVLETKTPRGEEGSTASLKGWRTAPNFFSAGDQWGQGATLLYPAGFQQGQSGSAKGPSSSLAATSASASEWMREFQVVGGLLDGILAALHPELYHAAIALIEHMFSVHSKSRAVLAQWPSCYSAVQVIVNRETVRHRDMSSAPGWLDIVLTLGPYGESAVMELRNLGVCVPYDAGTIVALTGRLVIHGVPKVPGDRICLAWYMYEDVFEFFEMEHVGMAKSLAAAGQATGEE